MKLLQKMGWQPGEGLGRNKEGTLEPLSLDIKMDKKGLLCKEELAPIRPTPAVKLMQDFQGKHPVSILHELCTKKHWDPPVFEQVADIGPDHLKHFLFKVKIETNFDNVVSQENCGHFVGCRSLSTESNTRRVWPAPPRKKLKPSQLRPAFRRSASLLRPRDSFSSVN